MKPEKFKEIRLKAGYSQARLSQLLNVSHGTISNWEKGYRPIPADVAIKMENYR